MFVSLNDEISNFIESKAKDYIDSNKLNIPIGTNIFQQLNNESILLLYPLFDENANGFCVTRTIKNKKKIFVFINTNNFVTKQVYTAAHEIGHIIEIDKKLKKQIEFIDDPEIIVNRFASELLMPKGLFISKFIELKEQILGKNNTFEYRVFNKLIFDLMLYFMVPYRAICYRMGELSILSTDVVNNLEKYEREYKQDIEKTISNYDKYKVLISINKKREFANLMQLVNNAEINNLTFKTKIDRIRILFEDNVQQSQDITIQQFEARHE